jgi:putative DNA primase/helicase
MTTVQNATWKGPTLDELKARSAGKWDHIFQDVAPMLRSARATGGAHVECPVHGGNNGFRLFNDYNESGGSVCNTCGAHPFGLSTLAWLFEKEHKKDAFAHAVKVLCRWLAVPVETRSAMAHKAPVIRQIADPVKALSKLMQAWNTTLPIAGSVGEKYLVSRGIRLEDIPPTLRCNPSMPYWDARTETELGRYPCLLAPIKSLDNKLGSLHRTFLDPSGCKAPVPEAKKMMPRAAELRGSAIQLYPAGETLGLAEGIETALAAHSISRMPVWACVSATLMELVEVPAFVKTVVVWADKDRSVRGTTAADTLADRLEKEGKRVLICTPVQPIPEEQKGLDWLDVLNIYGIKGFPPVWRRLR